MRRSLLPVLVSTALLLSACGSTEVVQPTLNVTIGQQLIDLKAAFDAGAMTQSEYDKQRKKLIDNVER